MVKKSYTIFACLVLCCLAVAPSGYAQQTKDGKPKSDRSPFRYIIASDKIDPKLTPTDEERRFVEVLMKRSSFNVRNLTVLFELLSKRFPFPNTLYVEVYTDLEDIQTPEERERDIQLDIDAQGNETQVLPIDLGPNPKDTATFTRYQARMSFRINYSNGRSREVVMSEGMNKK